MTKTIEEMLYRTKDDEVFSVVATDLLEYVRQQELHGYAKGYAQGYEDGITEKCVGSDYMVKKEVKH